MVKDLNHGERLHLDHDHEILDQAVNLQYFICLEYLSFNLGIISLYLSFGILILLNFSSRFCKKKSF